MTSLLPLPNPNTSTPLHLHHLTSKPTKPLPFNPLSLIKPESNQISTSNSLHLVQSKSKPINFSTPIQKFKQLIKSNSLGRARDLYVEIRSKGIEPGIVPESMLVDALLKSGRVSDAFQIFEAMPKRNVVTWTSMISGCARNGFQELGLSLFVQMLESDVLPNDFACNAAIQACTDLVALKLGEQVHSLIVRSGFQGDCHTGNCLMDFYSKCGLMDKAELVFGRMPQLDLVSFTSLISGYCRNNLFDWAVQVFDRMVREGLEPNEYTITSVLVACRLHLGEQIHGYMIKTMIAASIHSASALVEFYSRNHQIEQAKLVFEKMEATNVVTWSSIISCCLHNEQVDDALKIFCEMVSLGIEPNEYTLCAAIGACGLRSKSLSLGWQLHCSIIKLNMMSQYHVLNALLTMYARNGEIKEVEKVFEEVKDPDVVSWSAVISGYAQNGFDEIATQLFCKMHGRGFMANQFGISTALSSCANLSLSDQGRQFHCLALKLGCDSDICEGNALVNMYSKCRFVDHARLAFDVMETHDVMSWNSLIHGYAHHGHGKKAVEVFHEMVHANQIMPVHTTFVGLLFGCSHIGYVDQAVKYFNIMRDVYGVQPSASHFACIIDVMGRAGRLSEALQIIDQMPFEPDILTWKTLLGSCRLHKNLELGKLAAEKVLELSPEDSSSYVVLSNLHSMHGEWKDAERVRTMMDEKGVRKDAGWSWIEFRNEVHAFVASDWSHPESDAIYLMLEELLKEMKNDGYSSDRSFIGVDL